jgi:iron complex outermembrane receptor protein
VTVFNQFMRLENQQWGGEHGMGISGFGVGSIEVIKGPMSVLYGSDAVGGVVYVNPDSYFIGAGSEIELATIYNSNYNGFTSNLGIKGGLSKLSYLVQASLVDNDNFNTPDKEIENTYFIQIILSLILGLVFLNLKLEFLMEKKIMTTMMTMTMTMMIMTNMRKKKVTKI